VLATDPPAASGISTAALRSLAADAAARAWAVATGVGESALGYSFEEDLARRAASVLEAHDDVRRNDPHEERHDERHDELGKLARRADLARRELLQRALAWRHGGREGVAVLLGSFEVDPGDLQRARGYLATAGAPGARISVRQNRVTAGDRQLRIGRSGRWYPYRKGPGGSFEPSGAPIDPDSGADEGQ
jgi:hypothetical protein